MSNDHSETKGIVTQDEVDKKQVDKLRNRSNLPPIKEKKRKCLRCEGEFLSAHSGVRCCDECRAYGKTLSNNYWTSWGDA